MFNLFDKQFLLLYFEWEIEIVYSCYASKLACRTYQTKKNISKKGSLISNEFICQ